MKIFLANALSWLTVALVSLALLASCASTPQVSPEVRSALAPTGTLRAGINLGNGVVAAEDPQTGEVKGIAVSLARELGRRLGVPVELIVYKQARMVVDAAKNHEWDVAFLAIDPLRGEVVDFTQPYAEIEGKYLVQPGSAIRSADEVDKEGVRISVVARSNYDLFLTRSIKRATLVRTETTQGSADAFAEGKTEVIGGVRQRVEDAQRQVPGSRMLDGAFMSIRQAVVVAKGRPAGFQYAREFVEDVKASGFVAREVKAAGLGDAAVSAPVSVR
jgi:polar amino acid transport system substrate-binding protein